MFNRCSNFQKSVKSALIKFPFATTSHSRILEEKANNETKIPYCKLKLEKMGKFKWEDKPKDFIIANIDKINKFVTQTMSKETINEPLSKKLPTTNTKTKPEIKPKPQTRKTGFVSDTYREPITKIPPTQMTSPPFDPNSIKYLSSELSKVKKILTSSLLKTPPDSKSRVTILVQDVNKTSLLITESTQTRPVTSVNTTSHLGQVQKTLWEQYGEVLQPMQEFDMDIVGKVTYTPVGEVVEAMVSVKETPKEKPLTIDNFEMKDNQYLEF